VVRRVLALALLGLALIVCVALAASESLRNDSRKTSSGVTIQFSDSVRITSWDTATFPTSSPSSGRAESFTFSGGELASGGQFRVSWTPNTAEISNVEWETTGASTAGSSTGASTPLTYEQIMAQIAHYPGPDEPLYVPAEGELIWLTDLEGHADIYDNDSIKINYAPGFDKSQITRIDVYRNGVKMRFAPALFDVLTNEQMKTFDGNPAEDSPKSNHTDHAIFGYQYSLSLRTDDGRTLSTLQCLIASPFTFNLESAWAYVGSNWNLTLEYESLTDTQILSFFNDLKALGFTGLSVNVNCFVRTPSSNEVFCQYRTDPDVSSWLTTASDGEIGRILGLAGTASLQTEMRMQLFVADAFTKSHSDFAFSGNVAPSNIGAFFQSYGDLAVRLAVLAEQYDSVLFTPFTEMNSIERYPALVKQLYDRVAQVFSGRLAFEEGTHHYLMGFNTYSAETRFDRNVGTFWDWTDPVGRPLTVEWSCWTPPLDSQKDQRLSKCVEGMLAFWDPALDYYRTNYASSPIRYGEIGVYDADGIATGPAYYDIKDYVRDDQEVADVWAAYIIATEVMQLQGITVWDFRVGNRYLPEWQTAGSVFMEIGKTPALRVIAALIGGSGALRAW
jgi:hypothetical protein